VRAKQNFTQSLARQKSRLRALELYFFQFLPSLAFEFRFRKRRFPRQFIHQHQQRLRKFRKPGKRNRAGIRARAGREVRADAPQIFFDLPARALFCSRAHHRCGHFREPRSAMIRSCVS